MNSAFRILAAFLAIDLVAAILLMLLVAMANGRKGKDDRVSLASIIGALIFLAFAAALIYGGLWLCLQAAL